MSSTTAAEFKRPVVGKLMDGETGTNVCLNTVTHSHLQRHNGILFFLLPLLSQPCSEWGVLYQGARQKSTRETGMVGTGKQRGEKGPPWATECPEWCHHLHCADSQRSWEIRHEAALSPSHQSRAVFPRTGHITVQNRRGFKQPSMSKMSDENSLTVVFLDVVKCSK